MAMHLIEEGFRVRGFEERDIGQIVGFWRGLQVDADERLVDHIREHPRLSLLAKDGMRHGDRLIATIMASPGDGMGRIYRFVVHPDYAHLNVADVMLGKIERRLVGYGIKAAQVDHATGNVGCITLGFRQYAYRKPGGDEGRYGLVKDL